MSEIDITLLGKELLDDLNKNKNKRINSFDDVFSKVKKGNRESAEALKTIEKTYLEEEKAEKEMYKAFEEEINQIDAELKTGLDAYYANYNIENEQKKLQEAKDKGLQPKIMVYRKETHDFSFKLDRILKEEKDTLKDIQDEYDTFDKNEKSKIMDLEKKKHFEVNKEQTNTLNTYDDLQKSLLNTDNRHEIKNINKQIHELRKVGIQNEKKVKLDCLDLIINEKIAYANGKANYEKKLQETIRDYAIKKLELDTEKKHINLRYQIEIDRYDFGSRRALNNLNQKMIAKKNNLIIASKEQRKDKAIENQTLTREKIDYKKTITNDYTNVLENNYKAMYETIAASSKFLPDMYLADLDKITAAVNNILTCSCSLIMQLHDEYVDSVINNEYENIKLFVNAKNNVDSLKNFDNVEFNNKLATLFEEFKNQIDDNYNKHANELVELLNEAKALVEKIVNKMKENLRDDYGINDLHNRINELVLENVNNIKAHTENKYNEEYNDFKVLEESNKEYNKALEDAKVENDEQAKVHDEADAKLDEEIKAYNDAKTLESNAIDSEAEEIKNKYILECNEKISEFERIASEQIVLINEDKEKQLKEIEEDYQTQLSLLK